ncbi:MFS transporter [Streptomyces abikoensis]|uniref:MFS transporter n=1 Tax=Streptomyces abikoensis TaxID=97398 RepID=UPI0033E2155C
MTDVAAAPVDERVPPLRGNRDFRLLWVGAGLAFLGSRVGTLAYPLLVLWQTGSARAAGLVGFAATLPFTLVQLPAGVLVDRWDRRRLMIACDAGRCLAVGSVAVALAMGKVWLPHLAGVAFVETSLTILYRLAERAAVPNLVRSGELAKALSRNEAREQAAGLLGRPAGTLLFAVGRSAPFVFTAVAHLLALVTLLLIRTPFQSADRDERAARAREPRQLRLLWTELVEGVVWVWRHRFIRVAAGLIAVSNMLFQALNLALIDIVRQGGGSPTQLGLVVGVTGVGGAIGALTANRWMEWFRLPHLVIGANVLWALLMPLAAFTTNPFALGALFACMALAGAVWNVAAGVYQLRVTPDALLGRVAAVVSLAAFGTLSLGNLAGGFLLESLGARDSVLAISAVMALLALVAWASPAVRRCATPDEAS